ncbi:MAG TPA: hypothetical protein DCS67_02295 [Clostridiales bacterium UBA8960]|nr:hypothetical protein [Clostridiales bacterium UBA8960]
MAVFVFSIDLLSPLFFKWEFDEICRMYLLMAEANNGLSVAMRTELERALDELDLTEITIVCDDYGALKRGNVSAMEVQATFGSNQFVSLFNRTEKKVRFVFKQNFLARKIVM